MSSFNTRTIISSTRKEHQCLGCLKNIPTNSKAVNNKGFCEDWYNYYLHTQCDDIISKHAEFFPEGLWEGCINDLIDFYGKDEIFAKC